MENQLKNQAEGGSVDLRKLALEQPEEGVYYAYANLVNLNWTLTDLRIRFAELLTVPDENNPTLDASEA